MKNLNILQSGGGIYYASTANPFSNAAIADLTASAASSKSSDKDDGLIPKALMEKLSEKGIPTDVNKFMNMLADFEHKSSFGMGVDKRQLYKLLAYANQIIKQSEYLDAAEKRAVENGALDEVAVDDRGYLFVEDDKGQLKKVHASLFDASSMVALTNNKLLQHRKFNPNEVDNSSIATTVGNNIGIEKINDYIQGIIKAVGTAENSSEAYTNLSSILGRNAGRKGLSEQQLEAFRDLYLLSQQLGPDAILKVKGQYKTKNLEAAMSYIMSVLPNNMRTQLVARNVAAGGKYENSSKYAADIIGMAALAGNDTKIAQGLEYEASINKAAGSDDGSGKKTNMLPVEALILGSLGRIDFQVISNKYPELSMVLHGNGIGSLSDLNGDVVPKSPLSVALQESILPMVDLNHIFIGNQKISPALFDTIVYDGGPIINVWAPTDDKGDIDLERFAQFNELKEYINKLPELTADDKTLLLNKYGFEGTFDENGNFIGSGRNMAQFLVLTGLTTDEVVDKKLNIYADVLTKDEKEAEKKQIERIYSLINKGLKKGKYEFLTGWFNFTTDYIKAPVFLKLSNTALIDVETFTGHGPVIKNKTYGEMNAYDLARYNKPSIVTPSTSIL